MGDEKMVLTAPGIEVKMMNEIVRGARDGTRDIMIKIPNGMSRRRAVQTSKFLCSISWCGPLSFCPVSGAKASL